MPPPCYHYTIRPNNRFGRLIFTSLSPFPMSLPISKNWSSLLLPFVAGAIITALALSLFTGGSSGQSGASDLQGDVRKGTPEINLNAPGLTCGKTNCDLMAKLNQMHGLGGNSTATLHGLFLEGEQNTEQLQNQIWGLRGINSSGVSSWSLDGLAQQADMQANWINNTTINTIMNSVLGNSTWTLESLAQKINGTSMDAVAVLRNGGMGPSTWSLQALAQQIANYCQN